MPITIRHGFLLSKAEVDALCAFASSDEQRRDLNHIVFDVENGRIYATDGYTLVRATVGPAQLSPQGPTRRFGVPRGTLRVCTRSLTASQRLSVSLTDGAIEVGVTDGTPGGSVLVKEWARFDPDLAFPDHEQAIPEHCYDRRGASSAFNAEFFARLALVQRACGASGLDFFAPAAPLAGSVFEASSSEASWLAVVMPFRSHQADALARRWSRTAAGDELSAVANRKLSVPLFRRVVERLATLSVAEITCVEQILTTFAPSEPDASNHLTDSSHGGPT